VSLAGAMPEAARNARIQLRPKRMLTVAAICAVASITTYLFYEHPFEPQTMLDFFLYSVISILIIGGGIYCLQSVHREKELNTFDYQRVTRLTPLELTLGKLFGAPCLTYFLMLCCVPITVIAAYLSGLRTGAILEIYAIILLGTISIHALALLISVIAWRGTSAGAIIFFLALVYIGVLYDGDRSGILAVHQISPYYAAVIRNPAAAGYGLVPLPAGKDLVFGTPVSHVLVLLVLYVTFAGWMLLALVRNIKRDPSVYEIFTPLQGFGFVVYLQLIVLAFYQWTRETLNWYNAGASSNWRLEQYTVEPSQAEKEFLAISLWFFIVFGLMLLRNRERVRQRILKLGRGAVNWWAAIWPAPYLVGGILAMGLAMIGLIWHKLHPDTSWSFRMALFDVCFMAAWVARDAIYLQLMKLRRGRRSLMTGLIYLLVFYGCSSALWAAFGYYRTAGRDYTAYGAFLGPWAMFGLNDTNWANNTKIWCGALAILACEAIVFAVLQRGQLMKLRETSGV
jgi:hypothetical protein